MLVYSYKWLKNPFLYLMENSPIELWDCLIKDAETRWELEFFEKLEKNFDLLTQRRKEEWEYRYFKKIWL